MNRWLYALGLLILSMRLFGQEAGRIFVSEDRGRSWKRSDAGFPAGGTVNDFTRVGGLVFAGTEGDGVYASANSGRSWKATGEGLPVKINAVAAMPGIVFAGTHREGVFVSRDLGQTWLGASRGLTNLEVRRLKVVKARVFAATNGGLFVSEDEGGSWRHLTGTGQINGFTVLGQDYYVADLRGILRSRDQGGTWERVLDDGTPHNLGSDEVTVFALMYGIGVLKTSDRGAHWISGQGGLPTDLSRYTFQIIEDRGRLFAGQWEGIYVSDDHGANWRLASEGLPANQSITDLIGTENSSILAGAGLIAGPPKPAE